ncbi:MAG: cold shock domain-containing protein [Bacteroidales bacterium]|nr:cold shock domain-containing protein [Bacteroidales bacterium]
MARSQESWNKKDIQNKKDKKRKEKEAKKVERKENKGGSSLDDMIAYVDENGQITSTPPDPTKKAKINVEDIQIGVSRRAEPSPEDLIQHGIVTYMNDAKGFGFIRNLKTQESIFVHKKELLEPVQENNKVVFEVRPGPKGMNAVNVKIDR